MRQEFLNIVNQLKNNQYYAISIVDDSTMNKILTTSLGSTLVQKYGSVENYFENLKNSGVTSFSIQEYKKNGSGWKNTGNVVRNLTFQDKNQNSNHSHTAPASNPLNGGLAGQVVALGFTDVANYMADSKDNVRLTAENKHLTEKNEALQKLVDELKEEKLKREYDTSKSSGQNEVIMGVLNNLPTLLGAFTGGGSNSGLNAPIQSQGIQNTPIKNEFIAFLSQPTVSDEFIQVLHEVAVKVATEQGFSDKLEDLLNPQL
jgi:hypothetical protein